MTSKFIQIFIFYCLVAIPGGALAGGTHSMDRNSDDAAIGIPGEAAQVNRTVNIEMSDTMRFIPANLTVKQGETIKFLVKNSGKLEHEFVLGTEQELREHNELMKKFPEMEHADANMISVAPGQVGEVIWHFTKNGEVNFACLIPKHFEAGMKGTIKVSVETNQDHSSKGDGHVNHNH